MPTSFLGSAPALRALAAHSPETRQPRHHRSAASGHGAHRGSDSSAAGRRTGPPRAMVRGAAKNRGGPGTLREGQRTPTWGAMCRAQGALLSQPHVTRHVPPRHALPLGESNRSRHTQGGGSTRRTVLQTCPTCGPRATWARDGCECRPTQDRKLT